MRIKTVKKTLIILTSVMILAVMPAACGKTEQSSDIAGTYESGGRVYVFAEDGTVSVTENGAVRYGYYTADNGNLIIKLDGETQKYDYTFEGNELSLFSRGSLFGVSYTRTEDAAESVEGWTEPATLAEERPEPQTEKAAPVNSETTAEAAPETTPETAPETVSETAPETVPETAPETAPETMPETVPETIAETEPETPWVDTFVNQVKGDIYEGAVVTFGSYEQDNNASNGAEPIEWVVLKVDGDKALMISRYGLDNKAFNDDGGEVTWEWCSLRYWLNDIFLNTAFDQNERNTIQTTFVPGDWNVDYQYVNAGIGVEDKIFILSTNQAYIYLNNESRICTPTAYAVAQGAWYDEDQGGYWGWLRTPGNTSYRAACVYPWGGISYVGAEADDLGIIIRPALCVRFR